MDDVKSAAERFREVIRRCKANEVCFVSSVYQPDPAFPPIVVWQYLAEHPADDDEPINSDWLSRNFPSDNAMWPTWTIWNKPHIACIEIDLRTDGKYRLLMGWTDDGSDAGTDIKELRTRQEVRRVCEVFSVELKEV